MNEIKNYKKFDSYDIYCKFNTKYIISIIYFVLILMISTLVNVLIIGTIKHLENLLMIGVMIFLLFIIDLLYLIKIWATYHTVINNKKGKQVIHKSYYRFIDMMPYIDKSDDFNEIIWNIFNIQSSIMSLRVVTIFTNQKINSSFLNIKNIEYEDKEFIENLCDLFILFSDYVVFAIIFIYGMHIPYNSKSIISLDNIKQDINIFESTLKTEFLRHLKVSINDCVIEKLNNIITEFIKELEQIYADDNESNRLNTIAICTYEFLIKFSNNLYTKGEEIK